MKVALQFASLLEFLHAGEPPYCYAVRNINAAHIMLDKVPAVTVNLISSTYIFIM